MRYYNNVHLMLIFLIGLITSSCCDSSNNCCDNTKTESKYYKGRIINRAETAFPIGMIRFDDLYADDEELESPSRAIFYHVDDGGENKFNLYDAVYFKIFECGKFQYAINIIKTDSVLTADNVASKEEFYKKLPDIMLNLHNADTHREGPKHTRRHIIQRIGIGVFSEYTGNMSNTSNEEYWLIETREEYEIETDSIFVSKNDFLANPSGTFFFTESGTTVSLPGQNSNYNGPAEIYNFSLTHDHTH